MFDIYGAGLVICLVCTIAVGILNWGVGICTTSIAGRDGVGVVSGYVVLGTNCIA
jgi:hypothetical protein